MAEPQHESLPSSLNTAENLVFRSGVPIHANRNLVQRKPLRGKRWIILPLPNDKGLRGKIVCFLIIIIDVSAGILGIEAEVKGKHSRILISERKVPVHKAFKLGLAAVVLLTAAHAIANLLGGCPCICTKEEFDRVTADKRVAAATLVLSWVILAVGFALLMTGTVSHFQPRMASCGLLHRHLFFVGGILCFLHGLFAMLYYVSSVAASPEGDGARGRDETHRVRA